MRNSEKGSVLVVFSVFMLAMIPLLALSIDIYFMAQGRLEEQNLAEYASLCALDGYVSVAQELHDHDQSLAQAFSNTISMEGDNGVTGLKEAKDWVFSQGSCSGNTCQGSGWTMQFGSWDGTTFYPAVEQVFGVPSSIDADLVDAVRMEMVIKDGGFIDFFRKTSTGQEGNIKLPASAIAYVVEDGAGDKYYRLARSRASGYDEI